MEQKIKLYGISRKHLWGGGSADHFIEETPFKITHKFTTDDQFTISHESALRYLSWISGWNFANFGNLPKFTKSDIMEQIQTHIRQNSTSFIESEESDQSMKKMIEDVLTYFTHTIESMSSSFLSAEALPSYIPTDDITLFVPPISTFNLARRMQEMNNTRDAIDIIIPKKSDEMIESQLKHYVQFNELPAYKDILTLSYITLYRGIREGLPIEQIINDSKAAAYENRFEWNTDNECVAILKAEIADLIDALEIAVRADPRTRVEHFKIIEKKLQQEVFGSHQIYLIYQNFEKIKHIQIIPQLHMFLNELFIEDAALLEHLIKHPAVFDSEYVRHVLDPMSIVYKNIQLVHNSLNAYTQFKPNNLGTPYPYGSAELLAAYLFQLMLFMMTDMSSEMIQTMCVHIFGSVVIDIIYQRILTNVWKRIPPVDNYTKGIISQYNEIFKQYKISSMAQLRTSPNSNQYQKEISNLIQTANLDGSFGDFLITYNFSFHERYEYNLYSFAKRIKDQYPNISINENTFGKDMYKNMNDAIKASQNAHGPNNTVYLYDKTVMLTVFNAEGVDQIIKQYKGGELYKSALEALSGNGC
jgi:hypothetical protein